MEKYELVKDIIVMYVPAQLFPGGIQQAFKKLESKLTCTNDRALFGISWAGKNGKIMYKAAAEEKYNGEGKNYELEIFTITKGTYISELIKDYKKRSFVDWRQFPATASTSRTRFYWVLPGMVQRQC